MKKKWVIVAVINLLISGIMGAFLRFAYVEEVSWLNYRYLLHAHSHGAMLGWAYLILFTFLSEAYLIPQKVNSRYLSLLFWMTQISVIGMFASFPFQGYDTVSIIFSTLHILCSYLFMLYFLRNITSKRGHLFSALLAKAALWLMFLSTLGIWSLAIVLGNKWYGSNIYYSSVQFFLHFQFNGWFLFGVFALLFYQWEEKAISIPARFKKRFYTLLLLSSLLTIALPLTWTYPELIVYLGNSLGVIIQLIAAILLLRIIRTNRFHLRFPSFIGLLYKIAFGSFLLKVIMQALIAIPYLAEMALTVRNYVIGFIHLLMLGTFSCFVIAFAIENHYIKINNLAKTGLWCFIFAFGTTELILFAQGTMLWFKLGFLPFYYPILFVASMFFPIGIFLFLVGQFLPGKQNSISIQNQ